MGFELERRVGLGGVCGLSVLSGRRFNFSSMRRFVHRFDGRDAHSGRGQNGAHNTIHAATPMCETLGKEESRRGCSKARFQALPQPSPLQTSSSSSSPPARKNAEEAPRSTPTTRMAAHKSHELGKAKILSPLDRGFFGDISCVVWNKTEWRTVNDPSTHF